jgi:transient receptor potential cation channel subfamily C
VSAEETRKQEQAGVSEDDVNEIRQDISTFRFELVDILKLNGMRTPTLQPNDHLVSGRKGKVMERRLMKDFQIGVIENVVREAIQGALGEPKDVFARIARAIGGRKERKDWNAEVRSHSIKADPIGSKQTSIKRKSGRRKKVEDENVALFSMDPKL